MQKISKNISETEKIAEEFLKKILYKKNNKATVVGLYGDLGVGKTAFTQAVGKILKIKRKINSPTYVIMKKYSLPKKKNCKNFLAPKTQPVGADENLYNSPFFKFLIHIDAYRLKNEKELLHLGWEEIIASPENLIFIEWPEQVIKLMPKKHNKIQISHLPTGQAGTKEGHRKFNLKML